MKLCAQPAGLSPLHGAAVCTALCSSHAPVAAGIIPGFPGLCFGEAFGVNLCSFFSSSSFSRNFKGKEMIVFPPISLRFSLQAFSGMWKEESLEEGGREEGRGAEIRMKQKLDGINREAFCFISVFFFSFS